MFYRLKGFMINQTIIKRRITITSNSTCVYFICESYFYYVYTLLLSAFFHFNREKFKQTVESARLL